MNSTYKNLSSHLLVSKKSDTELSLAIDQEMKDLLGRLEHALVDLKSPMPSQNFSKIPSCPSAPQAQAMLEVAIQEALQTLQDRMEYSASMLENTLQHTLERFEDSMRRANPEDVCRKAEQVCARVEYVAESAIRKMNRVTQWFFWKKVFLVMSVASLVAVTLSMYLNAEWPWEGHQRALIEREVGQVVLRNWNKISVADREKINDQVQKDLNTV